MKLGRLGSEQEFDALSYFWGDVTDSTEIEMDTTNLKGPKAPFAVSPNVRDFLRRVRHEQRPLTLWIDQICINQSDKTVLMLIVGWGLKFALYLGCLVPHFLQIQLMT